MAGSRTHFLGPGPPLPASASGRLRLQHGIYGHRHGWSIRRFVKTARRYRTIQIQAGDHVITAADQLPDDLRAALNQINSGRPGAH